MFRVIAENPQVSQSDIARLVGMPNNSTMRYGKMLEAEKLVTIRESYDGSYPKKLYTLTAKGALVAQLILTSLAAVLPTREGDQ